MNAADIIVKTVPLQADCGLNIGLVHAASVNGDN